MNRETDQTGHIPVAGAPVFQPTSVGSSRTVKQTSLMVLDYLSIPLALMLGSTLTGHTPGSPFATATELSVIGLTVAVSALVFTWLGLYRAVVRFMGHDAVAAIVKAVTVSALTLSALMFLFGSSLPRELPVIYWFLLLVMVGGSRFVARSFYHHRKQNQCRRVAIYGAGSAGRQLLTALQHGDQYQTVLFIDDNPALHGSLINGVPVQGRDILPELAARFEVSDVFLAMASIGRGRRRDIIRELAQLPVQVRTIPAFEDLVRGRASIAEIQDISLEDLLGREPVPPHPHLVSRCIKDKAVMVTGAGGSIGSELCRQIIQHSPSRLLLLEMSEFALYEVEKDLREIQIRTGLDLEIIPMLGSVQDFTRMRMIMEAFGVETVYHAAAYKHVPIVEYNVIEGVRNNVMGSLNVARAAAAAGVDTFVLVSTDKAVRPANIMGASKRVAELICQALADEVARDPAARSRPRFVIVRFGNVLGSSGSVVPLFRDQIRSGGPVTVTHKEAQRYFMTIPEAAQLVLQAGAMGSGGDVFVLDMGDPIRIVDLARRMIRLAGMSVRDEENPNGDIEIRVTGLRPGEKLYEELLAGDNVSGTGHPMIMRALEEFMPWKELEVALDQLERSCNAYDCDLLCDVFKDIVAGFDNRYGCSDPLARKARKPDTRKPAVVEPLFPAARIENIQG